MNQIQQITSDSNQIQTLILADGSDFVIQMYFMPMQYAWVITSLTYANTNFVLNGFRISNSPNMLHQYRNQIPFGIACFSINQREPTLQQDFSSGASQLFILTAAEVAEYETYITTGGASL